MSKVRQPNGDDHPEAAGKHLADAQALVAANHFDGAAYLAGYVVECAMKTLILVEGRLAKQVHALQDLTNEALRLAALPGARTAKYASSSSANHPMYGGVTRWQPAMRYLPEGRITNGDAIAYLQEATRVYSATISQMKLDGVV